MPFQGKGGNAVGAENAQFGLGGFGGGICITAACVAILIVICWAFGGGSWW
jgi:hypothetical protein